MLRILYNGSAMLAYRSLSRNYSALHLSIERLASGLRINRAADDAAGLAISEKMRGQIRGLNRAIVNVQDGISLIQTAEGALNESHAILQRMRELSVQAANGVYDEKDRQAMQDEINQLTEELTDISTRTQFNKINLLDGSYQDRRFQIGANAGQSFTLSIADMGAESLNIIDNGQPLTLMTEADASVAIGRFDAAIQQISRERSMLGAKENRLHHTIQSLSTSAEHLTAAESRIRDVDIAKEMMYFMRHHILNQASQMMLAQAMQQPQSVLQLLR
ncbi:flagellin [Amphibacillus jilinensis]|uniref:flagellin N-terminal helical domain-containing protein n=1 Tax=Amphibacillus jilinensis TaxID=1216008 RepID=UPI00035EF3D0